MASPAGMRLFHSARFARTAFRKPIGRRYQSADASAAAPQNAFQRLWNSPVGIKTVHFWAPIMKWGVVLTGVSDFARPASSLSLTQNLAITATGIIWTRWCFIIRPKNVFLATVNFFLACVGLTQVSRIAMYRYSDEGKAAAEKAKLEAKEVKDKVKGVAKDAEGAAKKALQ